MENSNLINQKKLNLFQKIKKKLLLRNLTVEKYIAAEGYLKEDETVIAKLLASDPKNIEYLDIHLQIIMIEKNNGLIKMISSEKQWEILKIKPQYIEFLDEDDRDKTIYIGKQYEFIKYLPEDEQEKLLTKVKEPLTQKIIEVWGDEKRTRYEDVARTPTTFAKQLQYFSPSVVEKALFRIVSLDDAENRKLKRKMLEGIEIEQLPSETQLKIGLINYTFLYKMSKEAMLKFVGKNPIIFQRMVKDLERMQKTKSSVSELGYTMEQTASAISACIEDNPDIIRCLSLQQQKKIVENDHSLVKHLSDINLYYALPEGDDINIEDMKTLKKALIQTRWRDENQNYSSWFTDYIHNDENLLELGKMNPKLLSTHHHTGKETIRKKEDRVISTYEKASVDSKIIDALKKWQKAQDQNEEMFSKFDRASEFEHIIKLLSNEKVMSKVSSDQIIEFIENVDIDKMKEIIVTVYGETAKDILEDRPNLTLNNIHNLYIFDEKIINEFGIGMVHNLLSYETTSALVISELARDAEKLENYKKYSRIVEEYFPNTAHGLEEKLIAFNKFEEIIKDIDEDKMDDQMKRNLLLAINSTYSKDDNNISRVIPVEDIQGFEEKLNKIYYEAIQKLDMDVEEVKEIFFSKFFGMNYESKWYYTMDTASIEDMIKFYNLETFVKDERTQKSNAFTEDELDSLELIKIIDDIDQADILKEIFLEMAKEEKVVDPLSFRSIKQKVVQQYSKELIKSLSTTEELENLAKSGAQGISINNEEGIDIINLCGAEFRLFIHTTTMRSGLNNANLEIPKEISLDEMWKTYENGTSTISGCIIESDMMASCQYGEEINFGFCSIKPEQILGMGHTDIHVTHSKNKINPSFDYGKVSLNYPDELVRRTAAQIAGIEEKDITHPYNEVAMLRREINTDDIKRGTFGGRIMPDYIVVYGNATKKHKEIAKKFMKDGKPIPIIEIDTEAYANSLKGRAIKREDHAIHRTESKNITRIKDIARGEADGR